MSDTLRDIITRLNKKTVVHVGFFQSRIATIAHHNEFGTSRSPSRQFFKTALDDNQSKVSDSLADIARAAIHDDSTAPKYSYLGMSVTGFIQRSIVSLRSPPNAASTIAKKGSSNPLIDTGMMRQSVGWRLK